MGNQQHLRRLFIVIEIFPIQHKIVSREIGFSLPSHRYIEVRSVSYGQKYVTSKDDICALIPFASDSLVEGSELPDFSGVFYSQNCLILHTLHLSIYLLPHLYTDKSCGVHSHR